MTFRELRRRVSELAPQGMSTCIEIDDWDHRHSIGNPTYSLDWVVAMLPYAEKTCVRLEGQTAEEVWVKFQAAISALYEPTPEQRDEQLAAVDV